MTGRAGADPDALAATARTFGRSAESLRTHRRGLQSMYAATGWTGPDAARCREHWETVVAPRLTEASAFLAQLEAELTAHAQEQRSASAVSEASRSAVEPRHGLFGERLRGSRPEPFPEPTDGRDAVVDALRGLGDEARIGRDEIEIRALDNGRYIVVLPGVTDLSDGIDQFVERLRFDPFGVAVAGRDAYVAWADNDEPTVRKMRYAFEAAVRDDTTVNEYSVVVASALERAGVPTGAEVMLIGHSFGAYTAMDLAADAAFNSAHGEPGGGSGSGYHVTVTHVVAAGAETDWRLREVPAETSVMVLNNRLDLVYRAEDVLHRDGDAVHPGHVEQNFWGGWEGRGHDEHNYIEWLADTGNDRIETWLADVDANYTAAGTRVSVQVNDPNLAAGWR